MMYHGTRRPFTKGGLLLPVDDHKGKARTGQATDGTAFCYMTTDRELAEWYAIQAKGRGLPRVLTVEPIGLIEVDPSPYDYEIGDQYRCRDGARVIAVEVIR